MLEPYGQALDFTGRVAVVTGGASGIGFAVPRQLAGLGARIATADIDSSVMTAAVDVREPDDAAGMINEEWRRIIDIVLSGALHCARAAARHMVEIGYGRFVTLSSTAKVRGGTRRAAYGGFLWAGVMHGHRGWLR